MCGIAGIFLSDREDGFLKSCLSSICAKMENRGPDGSGYWSDPSKQIFLGHNRLSVIDIEARADQPMSSACGRYKIVFNGEIYNYLELKNSLLAKGAKFKTNSDTEVLLVMYAVYGESMLHKLRGMFALAIWDAETKSLFIARDPYGIKPLYLAKVGNAIIFASQVKALLACGLVGNEGDPKAQLGFWLFGFVLEPRTWFKHIRSLPSGCWCRYYFDGTSSGPRKYWNVLDEWSVVPQKSLVQVDVQDLVTEAVERSVLYHLVSDVPVGIFLSGGVDSSALAGLIAQNSSSPIKSVTLSFSEFDHRAENEVPLARKISNYYGIEHHIRNVSFEEFQEDLPNIIAAMDQPSIDGVNTWFASKAAAELGLKVVISGVGGDEIFGGYASFRQIPRLLSLWNLTSKIPGGAWLADLMFKQTSKHFGQPKWNWVSREANSLYGAYWLKRGLFTPDEVSKLMSQDIVRQFEVEGGVSEFVSSMTGALSDRPYSAVGQMETAIYLQNQLLRDADWASMAHGVELRTPLVDAWLLRDLGPVLHSFDSVNGKKTLADCPKNSVPSEVVNKRKTGFGMPLGSWMSSLEGLPVGNLKIDARQSGMTSRRWAQFIIQSVYQAS